MLWGFFASTFTGKLIRVDWKIQVHPKILEYLKGFIIFMTYSGSPVLVEVRDRSDPLILQIPFKKH